MKSRPLRDADGATTLGVRFSTRLSSRFAADADLGWRHTYGTPHPAMRMRFAAAPSGATVPSGAYDVKLGRDEAVASAGVTVTVTNRASLRLGYEGAFGKDSTFHDATACLLTDSVSERRGGNP